MKKEILMLSLVGLFNTAHANYVIDTEICAGTEYINDLNDNLVKYDPSIHTFVTESTPIYYSGYETVPHIWLTKNRNTNIFAVNTAEAPVNFFFRPTYYSESTGTQTSISPESFYGAFSSSNSPISAGGASMQGKSHGRISVTSSSSSVYFGFGDIYWDSSTCFEIPPMKVTIESQYYDQTPARGGISVYLVNEGKAW